MLLPRTGARSARLDPHGSGSAGQSRPRAKSRSASGYGCGGASGRGSVTPAAHRGYVPEGTGRVSPMARVIAVLSLGKEDLMLRRSFGPLVLMSLLAAGGLDALASA